MILSRFLSGTVQMFGNSKKRGRGPILKSLKPQEISRLPNQCFRILFNTRGHIVPNKVEIYLFCGLPETYRKRPTALVVVLITSENPAERIFKKIPE